MICLMRKRGSDGFTLLEMMLAIAILAVMMTIVAGAFNAVAHSKVQGESRLQTDREGRAIVWQMSNEIRDAVQTPFALSQVMVLGRGQMRDGAALDSLIVSTLNPGHRRSIVAFGPEDLVSYAAVRNPQHRGWFVLIRSQRSALLTTRAPTQPEITLADNVVSLHLRYFDGAQWMESWDSTNIAAGRQLPLAISIDLQLAADNGQAMNFSTTVQLPMAVTVW